MPDQQSSEAKCLALAAKQRGVITFKQARGEGLSKDQIKRRVKAGEWRKMYPGVYATAGSVADWQQRLRAALAWSDGGVVSHRSAALLYGFSRFEDPKKPKPVDVTLAEHARAPQGVTVHWANVESKDRLTQFGIETTAIPRTLIDLCTVGSARQVRGSLEYAISRQFVSLEHLERVTLRLGSHKGVARFRSLLSPILGGNAPAASELESRIRDLLERCGFPRVVLQKVFHTKSGKVRRMDFWVEGTRIMIEADGYAYHWDAESMVRDAKRDRTLRQQGYVVLRWTWFEVNNCAQELVDELFDLLGMPRRSVDLPIGEQFEFWKVA